MLLTIMSTKILTARPYQEKLDQDIVAAWNGGAKNVLAVLPTGGGKTFLFTGIIGREPGFTCAIAHRKELVGQMSLALNKRGVQHFVIAPDSTIKWIIGQHIIEHGVSHYSPSSRCAVAGVDTLVSRQNKLAGWCKRVGLWVQDEAHHLTVKNKWGKAALMFPNARGLMVTATPERADGLGLGRHADGIIDVMVMGPTARELINAGYLTDYRIFSPTTDIDLKGVKIIPSTGDYNQQQLVTRVRQSRIVGDVVGEYLKLAAGKLGVTFATDVETATDMALAYRAAGVPAEVVSAKTPDALRVEIDRKLKRGDLKNVVNVDIYGEGYDCPAIEVVTFARPTESYVLYCQQFGRGLRPMEGKTHAFIIDHVGNVMLRHGLPDAPRNWTLDGRERRASTKDPNAIPLKTCTSCTAVYEAFYKACPYCGAVPIVADRSKPEFVDGDLLELDATTLATMRGEIAQIDKSAGAVKERMLYAGAPQVAAAGAAKQHRLRQEAQGTLRESIALWAGWQRHLGRDDSESYKRFFWRFGTDVLTAQTLGRPEAERLTGEIQKVLGII